MRTFLPGSYYHIICRGNNNENVFLYKWDYLRYLSLLKKYSDKNGVTVIAYCLMPNHIHLLLSQELETPVSKFMQSLNTAYVMFFNLKHSRAGHLFQGKFKYVAVDTEEYLIHLSRYIHLNPSSAGIVKKPEDYLWSSYRRYLLLEESNFIEVEAVLNYFSKKDPIKDYREFVEARIDYQKEISLQKFLLEKSLVPRSDLEHW